MIINRDKYTDKCLQILNTSQFVKLNSDQTNATEKKVQNVLQKYNQRVFIEKLRTVKVPNAYEMVSFDEKALFTKVPLEYTNILLI